MTTDTALIEKREELKRRLAAGEYKTLVDVFLEWFERLLGKVTRRTKPLPPWFIATILSFVITVIGLTAIFVSGDFTNFQILNDELWGLEYGVGALWMISNSIVTVAFAMVINRHINRIIVFWRTDMLDATASLVSVGEFEDWLEGTCNRRLHFLAIGMGGLFSILFIVIPLGNLLGVFVGYGLTFTIIILNLFAWSSVFQLFASALLSSRLRQYVLNLFAADPGSSELLSRLAGELSFGIYLVAVFAAILTLTTTFVGLLPSLGILLVLLYWLPITAMFILNQTSLSSIIRRVKWKTLNEIQEKVEKLQTSKNFGNQETMDAIKRLMDYHDRVKATRDSALDFRAYLNFINSLLLPLLAFLLGNLDLVLSLFKRQP